ncbi:hypothetical protein IFT68_02830 [Oxalobacteraceae sp. CFBP 13730]|nr:hypothetical protein [Oxalobacteraceae sp. CFBP 13730]
MRQVWLALVVAAALVVGLFWHLDDPALPRAASPPPAGLHFLGPVPAMHATGEDRTARRRQLAEQVRLTGHTYCSYLQQSRYPHTSRPAAQHPDQLYPNQPVRESTPLRGDGGDSDPAVLVQTMQSRVYLAAGETVAFSLRAVDAHGAAVPLVVTRALAQGMAVQGARPAPRVTLAFSRDDGDDWRATFAPHGGALAGFHGTIRSEVRFAAAGRAGVVLFDVIYSPELPAMWTGAPREAIGPDSLEFTLPLDVRMPGRYVVSGRIDDALGRPFALASFNERLGQGTQAVVLRVHGKLLHDADPGPALPLVLRDVEGYLLRENADPDRLLLARREGPVLVSRTLSLAGVPDHAWQSEERSRYLAEYAKDRMAARERLAAFDPAATLPPARCSEPGLVQ